MTPEEMKEVRGRCEAATKAPWDLLSEEACAVHRKMVGPLLMPEEAKIIERPPQSPAEARNLFFEAVIVGWLSEEDANFVAHAREDLPKALDEIDACHAALADVLGDGAAAYMKGWEDAKNQTLRILEGWSTPPFDPAAGIVDLAPQVAPGASELTRLREENAQLRRELEKWKLSSELTRRLGSDDIVE